MELCASYKADSHSDDQEISRLSDPEFSLLTTTGSYPEPNGLFPHPITLFP
jgi:hypothetical protein